jgi:glycoprotein-N-acetylgalactosamine 3-beta-galactosyltransferase
MSGGAGYVLSREAIKRFVEISLPNEALCKSGDAGSEDVEIGICLENAGVLAGDSRDELDRGRFFPFPPEGHFRQVYVENWFENSTFYKVEEVGFFSKKFPDNQ